MMDHSRDDDQKAFDQAMAEVAPLGPRSRSDRARHAPAPPPAPQPNRRIEPQTVEIPNAPALGGQVVLDWRGPGLLDRDYHNLRRGRLSPAPEEIDLHGQDAREACATIATAIAHAQQTGRRSLCLIHGKGHHSESRSSRLKGLVDAALRQHPEVLGFHSVPRNTGAVNLLLRKARR